MIWSLTAVVRQQTEDGLEKSFFQVPECLSAFCFRHFHAQSNAAHCQEVSGMYDAFEVLSKVLQIRRVQCKSVVRVVVVVVTQLKECLDKKEESIPQLGRVRWIREDSRGVEVFKFLVPDLQRVVNKRCQRR